MAFDFMSILAQWEDMGVFNVLLPFLLVFAITFAILEKVKIFGADKRNINGIIAAILGILVARNQYVVGIINRFLPNISLFMVIILMFLLLLGIFGGAYTGWQGGMLTIAAIVSLFFVIWSLSSDFIGEQFGLPDWLWGFDEQTKSSILMIGIFVFVIWLVMRESGSSGSSGTPGSSVTPIESWLDRWGNKLLRGGAPPHP